jgi:hypothetical protein
MGVEDGIKSCFLLLVVGTGRWLLDSLALRSGACSLLYLKYDHQRRDQPLSRHSFQPSRIISPPYSTLTSIKAVISCK